MADAKLSSDIYDIAEYVEAIKQKYIESESEETLMMGIYGYMSSIFSVEMQNAIRIASQYSNEAIPTKAKFEKNILTHALSLGMTNINATPARMTVLMCFPEEKLIQKMSSYSSTKDKFILSKDVPITIEGFEYHIDYDIEITKQDARLGKYVSGTTVENNYIYSARYLIDRENPLSDITNPNLTSVRRIRLSDNKVMVAIPLVTIRQVEFYNITRKILTENPIENKTINFDFDNQLADFYVEVVESGTDESINLTPVYEGLYNDSEELYCNYTYINANSIRVKFDSESYEPTLNADVTIHTYLTSGESANFEYDSDIVVTMESTEYDYTGLYMVLSPSTGSKYGADKRSVESIKKAMAKEALARGSVTNTTDLENFFNSLSDENSKLYFYKKRHNLREVIYYSFILLKNSLNNILPTNTIDIKLSNDEINTLENDGVIIIRPGQYAIELKQDSSYGTITSDRYLTESNDHFVYISPFLCMIYDTGYMAYYLTTMNTVKSLDFDYINSDSSVQFIATSISWYRNFSDIYTDDNNQGKYTLTIDLLQNVNTDNGVITVTNEEDSDGNILSTTYTSEYSDGVWDDIKDINSIVAVAALYESETSTVPLRYCVGELTDYDEEELIYSFKFDIYTDDTINTNGKMHMVRNEDEDGTLTRESLLKPTEEIFNFNTMKVGVSSSSYDSTYFNQNMIVKVYVLLKETPPDYDNGDKATDYEYLTEIVDITGGNNSTLVDNGKYVYSLTNIYSIDGGLDVYANYTNIMESPLETILKEDGDTSDNEYYYWNYTTGQNDIDVTFETEPNEYSSASEIVYNDLTLTKAIKLESDTSMQFVVKRDGNVTFVTASKKSSPTISLTIDEVTTTYDVSTSGSTTISLSAGTYTLTKGTTDTYLYLIETEVSRKYDYIVKKVPLIKQSYINTTDQKPTESKLVTIENNMLEFIEVLEDKRNYIEYCLEVLEDALDIDLKFFNTYGPSNRYYIDTKNYSTKVNRVDISLEFNISLINNSYSNIVDNIKDDIKEYIEDIDTVSAIHIPNLITQITTDYKEYITYFEFLSFNYEYTDDNGNYVYGPGCQHISENENNASNIDEELLINTPEFLNVRNNEYGSPDIVINIV